ncbi:MAG: mannose-1-phosphate guanylyltransferase/mannose-6-phosphate isomerase [Gammaproteobacteria bacterium]|nr:mannose-1-phosphate guanylyltransferase/mannose-6-phosphate isomerase [Gammaproteobacteria bacterium]
MIIPVILCGGSGTRLWPLSSAEHPKQFLALLGNTSLLQSTIQRLEGLDTEAPLLVCNEAHRFIVAEQLRAINVAASKILLEPMGRNTAASVALAALYASRADEKAVLLVLPSDHTITEILLFHEAIKQANVFAEQGHLVTFGIQPSKPETGYGYIRKGKNLHSGAAFEVQSFIEKPDLVTAETFVRSPNYLWNSGMFLFSAKSLLHEMEQYAPDILKACKTAMSTEKEDSDFCRFDADVFSKIPSLSVDYAVMEKTDHAVVVPLNTEWSDIGSWAVLFELKPKDENGNCLEGNVVALSTKNSYLCATHRLLAVAGIEDLIVVETPDAVLVVRKDQAQAVKQLVEDIKTR